MIRDRSSEPRAPYEPVAPFEHADTRASQMLRSRLAQLSREERISGRTLARKLGINQSTTLSHWASGRVPIPIEWAPGLAEVLGFEPADFLRAVLKQRHPSIEWGLLSSPTQEQAAESVVEADLRNLAGRPLAELPADQLRVLYEAAADPQAARRWLAVPEINAVALLRELRPQLSAMGLSSGDRQALATSLRG